MTLARLASLLALAVAALVATASPAAAARTITYEVGTQGRVSTDVDDFATVVRSTLDDPRGWSLGGSIDFVPVRSDAAVRILIAEPAEIGAIPGCSAAYSCHVSGTVYINEDRWTQGAPGWSAGLDAYRHYVINHEVGHYLELGHEDCPAAGEPAPVMAQQTIETEPCRNRVWPLPDERDAVAALTGEPVVDAAFAPRFEQIGRLYFAAFARPPDPGGLDTWTDQMARGRPLTSVADAFVESREFERRYDEPDAGAFVDLLYENVLGRAPDREGRRYWVERLEAGATRAEVLVGFSESTEHRRQRGERVQVQVLYASLLDRTGEPEGVDHWVAELEAGTPVTDVVRAFLQSPERSR